MMSPHDQLVCAREILAGDYFPPTCDHRSVEATLESMSCLAQFRMYSVTLRRRFANDRGRILLAELRWLLDGSARASTPSTLLRDLIEALGRAALDDESGKRVPIRGHSLRVSSAAA